MTDPTRIAPAPRVHPTAAARPAGRPTAPEEAPGRTTSASAHPSDLTSVIRSKIQPPPLRSSTLSRQRLIDRLTDATSASRLTLVIAEAGYGKTTLLADFSSRASARCLWYRLDPTDADPITWTNYLIGAAREVDPDFGRATLSLLAQVAAGGPPESAFISSLLGELPRLGEAPTVLVLDDFHAVDDSPAVRDIVKRLVTEAPPWLHFVISSRRRPSLELARLAGMGEVAEIGTEELRFTPAETGRLFADGYGVPLDPDILNELGTRTRGWAASLQLFHGSIRGRPSSAIRALARSLSGANGPMYDFLAQEVLKNLPAEVEEFLLRSALLDRIVPSHVAALFRDRRGLGPDAEEVRAWLDDAERLALLTRSSLGSEARQLHPLLRDFLLRRLAQRHTAQTIRTMHLAIAEATSDTDPLAAARHYIEAGNGSAAMRCLENSVLLTMGSGQWGIASDLIDRLDAVKAGPAVAAIRARRLIAEGALGEAREILMGAEVEGATPDARAVLRHANLALAWRTGDKDLMSATLQAIQLDTETPAIMRDIFQMFVDAGPLGAKRVSLPVLAQRLNGMAYQQAKAGMSFYAAISLHNSCVASLYSGEYADALKAADEALALFDELPFRAPERLSTHSIRCTIHLELGNRASAEDDYRLAVEGGDEFADVAAELAFDALAIGDRARAVRSLSRAESLVRQGRTDAIATVVFESARAFADTSTAPSRAVQRLSAASTETPLDFGTVLTFETVHALALLLDDRPRESLEIAQRAYSQAQERLSRRAEARLRVLLAIARDSPADLLNSIVAAADSGCLALLEVADAIGGHLELLTSVPEELGNSIEAWPDRWLPVLRRQIDHGDVPNARFAAQVLDRYGELQDVGRLRAYARTYRHRGRNASLGIELAQRVSPALRISDLGPVRIAVGERTVGLSAMRRKPATLLLYLVTRPSFSANREQVLDELWPDTDPGSASNSLNQSLYFLRRELEPWYEDDVSVDYVSLQGELVWLDPGLVKPESAMFLTDAQRALKTGVAMPDVISLLARYRGRFAPEFEYEEWAMSWRSRVHTAFLELAGRTVDRAIRERDLETARDAAVFALDIEPDSPDLERRLVWLYWRLGARAAAASQHHHLSSRERMDGLEPTSLEEIVNSPSAGD